MKKALPYIIGAVLLFLIVILLIGGSGKSFDQRITLNKKDKIPYGAYVAYNNLSHLFPQSQITLNKKAPGLWEDSVLTYDTSNQALFILTKTFNPSEDELSELFHFVSRGNDVFISSYEFNSTAQDFFHFNSLFDFSGFSQFNSSGLDTLDVWLMQPPFAQQTNHYRYPGRRVLSYFTSFDSTMSYVLERLQDSSALLLRVKAGDGSFYIHGAPLTFSNYFLLHKNNMQHYDQLLSAISPGIDKIAWDEYFIHKPAYNQPKEPSPFRILMEQKSFRAAIYTALTGLIIFVLLGLKRNQRQIPRIAAHKNDLLEFVKTIGRLYFQKRDNKNICRKMSAYFTEHVYSHYKINTGTMDAMFVAKLANKSGVSSILIQSIVDHISFINTEAAVHDQQVTEFYELLEKFYKTA
ncbi:MAG: DUF4350 domain-containing protein [Agriterribacter sp.]